MQGDKSSITLATSVPSRARSCCFTYHDYQLDDADKAFKQYAQQNTRYMVLGYEVCPETGRPHLQGYVSWDNPRSLQKFQKDINLKKFHYEITRGSPQQASDYCKKDKNFWEYGELPIQGERTDWKQAVNDLHEGSDVITVVKEQPQLLPAIRALERFKTLSAKSTHRNVEVIFLVGKPGTGKTRWAWQNYPDLYSKPEGYWWDGYAGETTVLLDDFQGDIGYTQFLKVLDRYPLNLPIKGGFTPAAYTTVIITSNKNFNRWYDEPPDAIARRITKIMNLDDLHNQNADSIEKEKDLSQA